MYYNTDSETSTVMTNVVELPTRTQRSYKVTTAADLLNKEFDPINWAIPDILPAGVSLFGGREKMGKSWAVLGFTIAVATGGYVLGKIPVEQGTALYISLEDNERRIKNRLLKLVSEETDLSKFHYATEWKRTNEGGYEQLDEFLSDYDDTRFVAIDTLKRIRPRSNGRRNIYDVDYEAIEPYTELAAKHNTSIVFVHHLNQDPNPHDPYDAFQGSAGLPAAVESILLMTRTRGQADATLTVDGKDIEERQELALRWSAEACTWTVEGDAASYAMSRERKEIIEYFDGAGVAALTPKLAAKGIKRDYQATKYLMWQMGIDRQLRANGDGTYSLP